MSLSVGIVGFPNAGKSTFFNALTKSQVPAENFPFCTIEPNRAIVPVEDHRLKKLAKIFKSKRTVFSTLEFHDIAGIVKNAHKGEGLGNKFLANIRETDMILFVVRAFSDENVSHTENRIDPKSDLEILKSELILSDLETLEKRISKTKKESKSGNREKLKELELLEEIKNYLEQENFDLKKFKKSESDANFIKTLNLFSAKKYLVAPNIDEKELADPKIISDLSKKLNEPEEKIIPICAILDFELSQMSDEEQNEYLKDLNLNESSLNKLVRKAFYELNLIQFFTVGEQEARSWTVQKESTAPESAGKIHTDFEKKFIKADVINWEDLVNFQGWTKARESGKVNLEGKEYIVKDGDVMVIKHG